MVCAAYLAQDGQRVLLLEAADTPGGLAANREFHPGFRTSVAHTVSHFSQKVANDLKLSSLGYSATSNLLPTIGLGAGQDHVVLQQDSVSGASSDDVESYQEYIRLMRHFADALQPSWLKTMPRIGSMDMSDVLTFGRMGLNIRMLGKRDMREFLRIASLPARDLMDEFFDNDILKASLSWDGLIGSKLAPRSPNSAVLAMLYRMAGESKGGHIIPVGGIDSLVTALCMSATNAGVEIRSATAVDRILIDGSADGLQVSGVQLADGEKIEADHIISATDPQRTFLELVGVEYFDIGFTNRIRRLRCDGYVAKLHLALNGLPEFDGLEQADGRMIIASDLDAIEFAYDDAKYGECPTKPVMEIVIPSLHDASLAPSGQHVL